MVLARDAQMSPFVSKQWIWMQETGELEEWTLFSKERMTFSWCTTWIEALKNGALIEHQGK